VYDALTNQSEEVVTDINKLALTSDHWLIVREVCDLLDIFESETKRFSSQTYSTINEILPFHINSVKRLEEFKRKTRSGLIREACDAAIDKLEKYKCQLVDCDPIVFAMILDPGVKRHINKVFGIEQDRAEELLRRFTMYFNIKYNDEIDNDNNAPVLRDLSSSNSFIVKNSIFEIMGEETYQNDDSIITNEAQLWILSKPEKYSNIFQKWKELSKTYPKLARFARAIYAIQGSSVSLEAEFSGLSKVMNHLRTSMTEASIREQMCLRNWFNSSRKFIFANAMGLKDMIDREAELRRARREEQNFSSPSPAQ
jgi:hypothetical protein